MAQQKNSPELTPEDAMNRALAAEQQAAEAIRACEAEAERVIADARARARQIAERTDARISRLREHCAVATRRRADALLEEQERRRRTHSPERRDELIDRAVRRLAEQLTRPEREKRDSGPP